MKRLHARVTGRVQGVWYRKNTAIQAKQRQLTGYVRNMKDGSVEVVAEGEATALESLISWLNVGPELARVVDVRITWQPATGEYKDFRIDRT